MKIGKFPSGWLAEDSKLLLSDRVMVAEVNGEGGDLLSDTDVVNYSTVSHVKHMRHWHSSGIA